MSSPIRPPRRTVRALARLRARAPAGRLAAAVALAATVGLPPLARAGAAPATVGTGAGPREYGCPILPARDALNTPIANAPVDPRSAAYVASIGLAAHLHPDFGVNPSYGIPYDVVAATQPRVAVRFTGYPAESDPGPYPIPPDAPVEGAGAGGDRHVLIVQRGTCTLYELYAAERSAGGWRASNGAVFDLRSTALRPAGWTSADAAGLPIFPLLVRYPEVASGRIDHALRVTVPRTQHAYIHPATHFASSSADPSLPPMGLRLRLKAAYSLAGFSGQSLVILRALKRYGLIVADNGSPWYITGAPSTRWNEASLAQLRRVPGSAFEAVRTGAIIRAVH
jgi:hypothetical protein